MAPPVASPPIVTTALIALAECVGIEKNPPTVIVPLAPAVMLMLPPVTSPAFVSVAGSPKGSTETSRLASPSIVIEPF